MSPEGNQIPSSEFLRSSVRESGTRDDIKTETYRILEEASEIRERLAGNEDALREYEMVRLATVSALADLGYQTREELEGMRSDIDTIHQETDYTGGSISEEGRNLIRRKFNNLSEMNVQQDDADNNMNLDRNGYAELPEEIEHLARKAFGEYTSEEAIAMLEHYRQAYSTYQNRLGVGRVSSVSESDSWSNIRTDLGVRQAQEILIEKAYGRGLRENGFNNTRLVRFNADEGGNTVVSISDFENQLRNTPPENWNSLALVNYFKHLESKEGELNLSVLLKNIPANQIIALGELWKTSPNGPAMEYFAESSTLNWIIEGVQDIPFGDYINSGNIGNIQDILRVIDHSAEVDEAQEVVSRAMQDLFDEIDFYNPETQIFQQLSSLSDSESAMIQFMRNISRTMLSATDLIQNVYIQYSDEEAYGSPRPDVHVFEAFIKTIVFRNLQEEDAEETLVYWIDNLNDIITNHNEDHNTNYPLLDDEVRDGLSSIYFATGDIVKIQEFQDRINVINERLEQLGESEGGSLMYRSLEMERMHLQRSIGSLQASYNERMGVIQDTIQGFTNERPLSENDIRYIMKNPKRRLKRINNPQQLLEIFRIHSEALSSIHIENISPFTRRNIDTIREFPGELTFDCIQLLTTDLLADQSILEKFLSQNMFFLGGIVGKIRNSTDEVKRIFYTSLANISESYPIPGRYRSSLGDSGEFNIRFTENERSRDSLSEYGENEVIADLWRINEHTSDEIKQRIGNFIQYRAPDRSDNFMEALTNLAHNYPEIYTQILDRRGRIGDKYRYIDYIVIRQIPDYFSNLPLSQRRDRFYINALIDSILYSDVQLSDNIHLLLSVELSDWSSVTHIFRRIGVDNLRSLAQRDLGNLDPDDLNNFITDAFFAFDSLSDDRKMNAMQNNDESEIIRMLQGLDRFISRTIQAGSINEDIQNTLEDHNFESLYHNTLNFINRDILENERENIIQILRESNGKLDFSDNFTAYLSGRNLEEPELERLVLGMLEALSTDIEVLQNSRALSGEITDNVRRFVRPGENGENHIDRSFTEAWNAFRVEKGEELNDLDEDAIINLFLTELGIDRNDPNYDILIEHLVYDAIDAGINYRQADYVGYIEAVRTGNIDDFNRGFREAYNRGEITSRGVSIGENTSSDTTLDVQNFAAQNPEFRTFQTQIGSEMGLSIQESRTLSRQEMQILGNNETARERFLSLREMLKEARMEKVFMQRNNIMRVISNVHGIAFTLSQENYLSDAEMMRFIGETVYATLGDRAQHLRSTYSSTQEMINQVVAINNDSASGRFFAVRQDSVNIFGDSYIENEFINKFAPRGQLYFNFNAFEEALRS